MRYWDKQTSSHLHSHNANKYRKAHPAYRSHAALRRDFPPSYEATMEILHSWKNFVENQRGWAFLQAVQSDKREKAAQHLLLCHAIPYSRQYDLDISPETDAGRGSADVKVSRGRDKTLVEIKLSSNPQYIHGYQTQLQEYSLAEETDKLIYVFIDVGNPLRREKLRELHRQNKRDGILCPELIIIDAQPKCGASTY